ncbi:hypothetical protein [Acetobacter sp. A11-2]|uniref:phage tail assembly chaperone n=1 Tax=Acetobacter sp. A11-2 TaxID=3157859 RepID=UPI0032ED8A88
MDPQPEFMWIWRAWHRLSASRQRFPQGFSVALGATVFESSPGMIPWEVVQAWAQHHGYTHAEMALLDRCIVAMDRVFIEDWAQRMKRRMKK